MQGRQRSSAFTLIELLVVVAIIALLISILLPTLNGAKEQGKRAVCLNNLKSLSTGMQAYAGEDSKEQLIPIHQNMVRAVPALPGGSMWIWRTAHWFMWGGRNPPKRFLTACADESNFGCGPQFGMTPPTALQYAARTRPLNRYVYGGISESDEKKMELYHCPSDVGYPDIPFPLIDDSPQTNALRACYDTIGNSYRGSLFSYIDDTGAFAIGPWGHRLSTLQSTSRLIVFGEPTFFNMIGQDNGSVNPDPVIATGWHKKRMTDNIAFADGSARSTQASGRENITDAAALQQMGVDASAQALLSRGPSWTFDCWPTAGARIWGNGPWLPPYSFTNVPSTSWPLKGAQRNFD